jgi:hypothetical protein
MIPDLLLFARLLSACFGGTSAREVQQALKERDHTIWEQQVYMDRLQASLKDSGALLSTLEREAVERSEQIGWTGRVEEALRAAQLLSASVSREREALSAAAEKEKAEARVSPRDEKRTEHSESAAADAHARRDDER